jgi:RNA polymerase sigma factor (sigma-70 family)
MTRSAMPHPRSRCASPPPVPSAVRRGVAAARTTSARFTIIVDHLRPELTRVARAAGAGAGAEDVVSDVIARHLARAASGAHGPLATADGYQHLRASLLVSVRNAARNWQRDNRRTIAVAGEVLADLVDHETPVEEALFDEEDVRALRDAIDRLGPEDARVAQLIGVEEFSSRQAAALLGLPKSTVHDAWGRARRAIRESVERYLEGGYCSDSAPYLALLDAQRRAEWDGAADRPLDDVVGAVRAAEIARHVYGGPGAGGCPACRLARARERAALRSFLPPVVIAPPAGRLDAVRDALLGTWDAVVGGLARLADDATGALLGAGGGAAGIGGTKTAAILTSATLAVGASTVAPRLATEHGAEPRRSEVVRPAPARPSAALPARRARTTAASTATRSTADPPPRRAQVARTSPSRPGSPVVEFTPGP